MKTSDEIWILGATGRSGRAIAKLLHEAGVSVVLVGRDRERLANIATELGNTPRLLVGSLDSILADLTREAPAVVVNTIGPFTITAPKVARSCPPGTHYVDIANELQAVQDILDLGEEAAATGRVFVTGAGFGVFATESVLLHLCEGKPAASQVRVDAVASVALEAGVIGSALAATIVDGVALGGRQVRDGLLVRSPMEGKRTKLTTPDGDVVTTAASPSGELIAAWRGSKAPYVVAASIYAPAGVIARLLIPALSATIRIPAVGDFAVRRMAKIPLRGSNRPREHSWAHARVEWSSGVVREGWLRVGDGSDFTALVAVEVARRLRQGEGKPGAYTPGALFGPTLALSVGGEFFDVQ